MHGQRRDVFPALPQSRQMDLDGIEPEQEVLAKLAGLARGRKIVVGSRDHANINLLGTR